MGVLSCRQDWIGSDLGGSRAETKSAFYHPPLLSEKGVGIPTLSISLLFLFFSFLVRKIPFAGVELTSQRVRGLRVTSELPGRPVCDVKFDVENDNFQRPIDAFST